jgi:hypothetical protein
VEIKVAHVRQSAVTTRTWLVRAHGLCVTADFRSIRIDREA